ncbi:MAG: hypothetical protein WB561_20040 [Terracidiphilus sp.]
MALHWTDLILILALVAAGSAASYMLMLRKLRQIVADRQLKLADQLAALDDAIRALETRLVEHHMVPVVSDAQLLAAARNEQDESQNADETQYVAPEIRAVIAAAAVATLGQDAQIRSIKAASSPWSQQGRVLVQGSHNLRVRG